MSDIITVRPVVQEDFPAWKVLWDGYNAFYGRQGETALPLETTRTTWARFFDAYEPMYALVAVMSGEIVGLAHYIFHRSTISINSTCYLQDLFTSEPVRGKGIGRALIEAVADRAKVSGSVRVYWLTHETNVTAMKLYDKVADKSGFVVYRRPL